MRFTRVTQPVRARPGRVYQALIDPEAVVTWMVPPGMRSEVHAFDAREGGSFRISLSYRAPTGTGKTSPQTDTFHGRFVELVPGERVVQVVEFETDDPVMRGEMTIRYTLVEAGDTTYVAAEHENLPPGLSEEDNALGWRLSLAQLAKLVEAG
ncbi:MAG: polyketide cyclase [Myxococcaceae bacterium]|nr:MAG: polyketide cyclase [Myxococcaceae bacterium]